MELHSQTQILFSGFLQFHVFVLWHLLIFKLQYFSILYGSLQDLPQYEMVLPTRVDARGHFLSNFLSHHTRRLQRRDAEEPADLDRVFYQFWHGGHVLHFNLTLNRHLLAPGFLTETRYGGLDGAHIRPPGASRCHFLGEVWDEAASKGSAAISACDGLTGLFKLSDEEFFIQPLEKQSDDLSAPQPHAIYKRHASPPPWSPVLQPSSGKQRERWELRQQRKRRRIRERSISREKWVETLVVADPKMVDHHGSKAVESYVLAVMNIVAGLFRDASIGNAINIVVVRLILLEQDEGDLKITHHADNSLNSFCKWQKKLNMKGDEHPLHHDVAVLLTRKDICAAINRPCETLGLSHVAGMCQPHRSCSISEDTGLPLAFTVAHELGHNFGIQHDGNGNDCEPIGKRPFVMSPQLLYGTSLPRWSRCSRQYITRFLDRGWGWCLDDAPGKDRLSLSMLLPGVLYSAIHQCRLQYGSGSVLCDDMDNVCSTLWCTVGTTCHSKLDGAVDGTSCGDGKWCFGGECVVAGFLPEKVDGGWAAWSEWSACSRTCGAGVQSAERDCDNPVPKYRGKYCLGDRRRYKICNMAPCPKDLPTFRNIQCSHFNTLPYKGKFYKWESVINRVNPCELHCRPLNEHFSEKLRDAVTDGTPCYEGNKSRDVCINGICKNIGCDYVIDSNAVEDRCGVCHGNGSTCTTVRKTFQESEGLGYVDIGLIPEGAWDIRIEEVAEAGNFLALRGDSPNRYFLNGGWTIQWNGEYKAAGTVFTYERTGHLENLTSPGPTMEPLWIQLLFQETNPGVRYEYTISQNVSEDNNIPASLFSWKYGSWAECSVTCGAGVQRQIVHCVEKTTGIVDEHFCDHLTRPDDNQTSCSWDPCPATWWVGEWQKCSASCGSSGLAKRAVLCIQAVSVEEQEALEPSNCQHIPKPESLSSCNTHIACPADWTAGGWSKCSLTCGSGVCHRNVTCSRNTSVDCDPLKKPPAIASCHVQDCPQVVDNFGGIDWSGNRHGKLWRPENTNAKPGLVFSTEQPTQDVKWGQYGEEAEKEHAAIPPRHPTTPSTIDSTTASSQETDERQDYEYIYADQEDLESPEPLGSPMPETIIQVQAEIQLDENASEIPQTTTESAVIPVSFTLEDLDMAKTPFNPIYATSDANLWNIDSDLGATSLPASEKSTPLLIPFLLNSGNQEASDSTPLTGTEIIPPTDLDRATQPSPDHFLTATTEQITTNPAFTETTGTAVRSSISSDPDTLYRLPTNTESTPQYFITPAQHVEPSTPAASVSPTHPPLLWSLPVATSGATSASTRATRAAYWVAGNWSACSTTCGLGAIWRTLACSTGSESDCDPAQRPAPAQQCYLRPCSTWRVGEWSKCSKNCEGGIALRDVQCFDLRDQRPLRPFHCRAMSSRPQTHKPCNLQPCLQWYTSSWGQCSEMCGGGEQQRIVTCPEDDGCDTDLQPSSIQPCNSQPCAQWLTGSWGQCSASCGGGVQHRLIRCVDTKAEADEEVDQARCDHQPPPESSKKCNLQECESMDLVCLKEI
uniref:Peptidase M12B domain-containing protein n=1 Tax=Amphiprion ocellaris TaxID=80972 RepID=A0A3Q1B0I5_AMPOC